MMRAAGIRPASSRATRAVTGNPVGGYLLVRQSHAHAWSRSGSRQGWYRIDPTAAVAPERIERGIEASSAGPDLLLGGVHARIRRCCGRSG